MAEKLWGGRFTGPAAEEFERWSASYRFDRRLATAEVIGTRAHARGLGRAGILDGAELAAVLAGLEKLALEAADPPADGDWEDVHTWAAQRLFTLAGPAAAKLQTGRSRNEQVALDLKLYLLARRPEVEKALAGMVEALADFAEREAEVLIPGYTHLQRAQPVSLGHHALAYAEMLMRDGGRIGDAYVRMMESPLGSGALAGTPLAVNREAEAREMGFARLTQNSLDAVSDRDFALELVFALHLVALHLSRWCEDWILFSSPEFGWLRLPEAYATGSSLMPQKCNPDALELIRGKCGRQAGNLARLQMIVKGLPLAYNRDLQEDKEPVFDAVDTAVGTLRIAAGVAGGASSDAGKASAAVADAALLATDLADLLVETGMAFAEAHHAVGRLLSGSDDFRQMSESELERLLPGVNVRRVRALSAEVSVARRDQPGGTAINRVREQAVRVRAWAKQSCREG